jgi:opacity protein-like surface antigen
MNTKLLAGIIGLLSVTGTVSEAALDGFSLGISASGIKPEVIYTDHLGARYEWSDSSVTPDVTIDYGYSVSDHFIIVLGGSFGLDDLSAGTQNGSYGKVDLTIKDRYSVYFQPKYCISDKMAVYLSFSYNKAKVDVIGQNQLLWIDDHYKVSGIGYGIGFETIVFQDISIGLEYQYVDYNDEVIVGAPWTNWHYQQSSQSINIAVKYRF